MLTIRIYDSLFCNGPLIDGRATQISILDSFLPQWDEGDGLLVWTDYRELQHWNIYSCKRLPIFTTHTRDEENEGLYR